MDSTDKINTITKSSNYLLINISPETISSISNAMKAAAPVLNNIYDLNKNFNSTISSIINSDLFKNINNKLITSFYNIIDSDLYKNYNTALQQVSLQMLDFINSDTFKNFYATAFYVASKFNTITTDLIMNISFNTINAINSEIEHTVNKISEKADFEYNDIKKLTELSTYVLETTVTNNYPKSVKKNILINLRRNIWKLMGIPQFAVILTIVIFLIQNTVLNNVSEKIIIRQTINEIIIIEKENIDVNLRGITNNNTKLYMKPNTKSQTIFTLDCGDIIEVIKIHKKWVYVRLYKTDIKGWVLKKYTKGPKFKKKDSLTIL